MRKMSNQEKQLMELLSDMNEDDALELAKRMLLKERADPLRVLALCGEAVDTVGKRFEEDEYFLPERVLAGDILETITAFEQAGMRRRFKVMIGGSQIDDAVRVCTGADSCGINAVDAVDLCKSWMGAAA